MSLTWYSWEKNALLQEVEIVMVSSSWTSREFVYGLILAWCCRTFLWPSFDVGILTPNNLFILYWRQNSTDAVTNLLLTIGNWEVSDIWYLYSGNNTSHLGCCWQQLVTLPTNFSVLHWWILTSLLSWLDQRSYIREIMHSALNLYQGTAYLCYYGACQSTQGVSYGQTAVSSVGRERSSPDKHYIGNI